MQEGFSLFFFYSEWQVQPYWTSLLLFLALPSETDFNWFFGSYFYSICWSKQLLLAPCKSLWHFPTVEYAGAWHLEHVKHKLCITILFSPFGDLQIGEFLSRQSCTCTKWSFGKCKIEKNCMKNIFCKAVFRVSRLRSSRLFNLPKTTMN